MKNIIIKSGLGLFIILFTACNLDYDPVSQLSERTLGTKDTTGTEIKYKDREAIQAVYKSMYQRMTGQQEHPGTGRNLLHHPTGHVRFEDVVRAMGIRNVVTIDPMADATALENAITDALDSGQLAVIVARKPCILAAPKIRVYERAAAEKTTATQ